MDTQSKMDALLQRFQIAPPSQHLPRGHRVRRYQHYKELRRELGLCCSANPCQMQWLDAIIAILGERVLSLVSTPRRHRLRIVIGFHLQPHPSCAPLLIAPLRTRARRVNAAG